MSDAEATDEFLRMQDKKLAQALYCRYMEARSFFDRAVDDRNNVARERDDWRAIAEGRVRSPFAAVLGVACFILGILLGISLQWVPR